MSRSVHIIGGVRTVARQLGLEMHAKIALPRLRRSRIWHCFCAHPAASPVTGECSRTACEAVGPSGAVWNGIAVKRGSAGTGESGAAPGRALLYVNDLFRRVTAEFEVSAPGRGARLRLLREFRAPYLVDNVHLDASGGALWVGARATCERALRGGGGALQAKAAKAHAHATSHGLPTPRPHTHLRPTDGAPEPPMASGVLSVNLSTGAVSTVALQSSYLASVAWGVRVGGKLVMGSPWDDGVLVCEE
jgi:hypothetical protein